MQYWKPSEEAVPPVSLGTAGSPVFPPVQQSRLESYHCLHVCLPNCEKCREEGITGKRRDSREKKERDWEKVIM